MRADEITLTLPRDRDFYEIAHLVLGGLAVRLDLTVDQLDDLQVALDTVLQQQDAGGELTIAVRVEGGELHTLIGPFPGGNLRAVLEREDDGEQLSMRRLLGAVCDRVEVQDHDDEEWIGLTKAFEVPV